jgi:F-type H+-transporting ATPase subunit gamma
MPTLRQVRGRIVGVRKTQKITRAMKMVASARLRRAQMAVLSARPYAEGLRRLLADLAGAGEVQSELFAEREVRSVALLVVTSDRGLCGAFNTNLVRAAIQHVEKNYPGWQEQGRVKLVCIGRKGYDILSRREFPILERMFGVYADLAFGSAKRIASLLVGGFLKREFDRVELLYNRFQSVGRSVIAIDRYLPIPPQAAEPSAGGQGLRRDYIYEPSRQGILDTMVPRYLDFIIWRVLLESNAAEQAARMTAMDNATENASELIDVLQLQYNKARQASITKELLEVVAGAEALRQAD